MALEIRKAKSADKEFILEAIIESEKSGSDIVSYCALFEMSEVDFRVVLSNILDEDMEGQELCISSFMIAVVDGERAAALSTWIENEDGMASSVIKSNLLMYFMDRTVLINAAPNIALLNELSLHRDEETLQIESVYTSKPFRGRGLVKQLIEAHIETRKREGKQFDRAQIILLKNNESAIRSYEKAGFTIKSEKSTDNGAIYKLLPCNTKILMEKHINHEQLYNGKSGNIL